MNKPSHRKEMEDRQWYFSVDVAFRIVKTTVLVFVWNPPKTAVAAGAIQAPCNIT